MRLQYISSACVLVEHDNVKVLCDPWLTEGIYYGSWYHYPLLKAKPEDFLDVDYLFITHVHPDHCDAATLKYFAKDKPVLILEYEEKFMIRILKNLGYENIIELPHKKPFALSEHFQVEMFAADNCDPTLCGKWFECHVHSNPTKTLQIDSLAVFSGGGKVLVNTNDCPFALSKVVCEYIIEKYRHVDLLLTGYSGAGPYPQCSKNLDLDAKIKAGEAKKLQNFNQAISYIHALKPDYFLPFAGQYTLGGALSSLNPYRGVPELEELIGQFTPLLKAAQVTAQMILLNTMEFFDLDTHLASAPFVPPDPIARNQYIKDVLSAKKYEYEEMERSLTTMDAFLQKLTTAHQRLKSKLLFYGFSTQTNVYLDIGEESVFCIPFNGENVRIVPANEIKEPFVTIGLHPGLLEMILNRKAIWNNAEIGSHLTYDRKPNDYERGIYYFLSYLN